MTKAPHRFSFDPRALKEEPPKRVTRQSSLLEQGNVSPGAAHYFVSWERISKSHLSTKIQQFSRQPTGVRFAEITTATAHVALNPEFQQLILRPTTDQSQLLHQNQPGETRILETKLSLPTATDGKLKNKQEQGF